MDKRVLNEGMSGRGINARTLAFLALLSPMLLDQLREHSGSVELWTALGTLLFALLFLRWGAKRSSPALLLQLVLHLGLGVLLFFIYNSLTPGSHQGSLLRLSLWGIPLSGAAIRFAWGWDRRDLGITLGLSLLSLMALSRSLGRPLFASLLIYYLICAFSSLRLSDPSWAGRRGLKGLLLPGALMALLMGGLSWALPVLEPILSPLIDPYLNPGGVGVSGAGGDVSLGHLEEILSSDKLVLKVKGPRIERLRGRVFQRYRAGQWYPGGRKGSLLREKRLHFSERRPSYWVEVEPLEPEPFLFTTLETLEIRSEKTLLQKSFGVVQALESDTESWSLGLGEGSRAPGKAEALDLEIPEQILAPLQDLASTWIQGAEEPRAQLKAIKYQLAQEFRYALSFEPEPLGRDPILHFLLKRRSGHCEFFASSFTLLARSLNIPARLITGYLVQEYDHDGGFALVRGQDAHAWVEVLVDGNWETLDPTPAGALPERAPSFWGNLLLRLREEADALYERITTLGLGEITALILSILEVRSILRDRVSRDELTPFWR